MMMKGGTYVKGKPKKTRQGNSQYTLRSATSRNKAKKKYRGQGKQKQLHLFIMAALICNLPSVEVWVRKEYLTDHQSGHGEFVKGVWVSAKSIPGRTFYFETYLPEYAAMYDKLPISAFVSAPETPSPDMDLPNLQFWNCMDYGVVAVTKQFIGSMDYELYTRDFGIQKGTYICTIDNYHQDPEVVDYATSENPAEHKSHNLIELEIRKKNRPRQLVFLDTNQWCALIGALALALSQERISQPVRERLQMGTRMYGNVEAVDKEKTSLHVLNVPQTVFPICMTRTN